jgi:mannose-6-phosphate isomerase
MADSVIDALSDAHRSLHDWLAASAYPIWWERGADATRGGFHERLQLDGKSTEESRRARLHPRQIFCYAYAPDFGWQGPAPRAVEHGLDFFTRHYRRPDGLYRTLVAPDGAALDDSIVLYDQSFALLGFASAFRVLGRPILRDAAHDLHTAMQRVLGRGDGGFDETPERRAPLTSNSHMHLLEASLAWHALDADPRWLKTAANIVQLALTHWIDPATGAIREFFETDWKPVAGDKGRIVEPGHQFEWAWLLTRFATCRNDARAIPAALRLIEFGEQYGVDRKRGVAINSCMGDGQPHDASARLWPQTERIKATLVAAELTGDRKYASAAHEATVGLLSYFNTPLKGLWRDQLRTDGVFVEQPAPASSFYHIVAAALELQRALPALKRVI